MLSNSRTETSDAINGINSVRGSDLYSPEIGLNYPESGPESESSYISSAAVHTPPSTPPTPQQTRLTVGTDDTTVHTSPIKLPLPIRAYPPSVDIAVHGPSPYASEGNYLYCHQLLRNR